MLWLIISSCHGGDIWIQSDTWCTLQGMAEIRNQWKKMSPEEKAPFKEQAKTHFVRYQQQRVKSLTIQEKYEVKMISLYVYYLSC